MDAIGRLLHGNLRALLTPSRGPRIGPELIADPGFASAEGWTLGEGWSVAGGKLVATAAAAESAAGLDDIVTAGRRYRVAIDVESLAAGTFQIAIGGGDGLGSVDQEGRYSVDGIAPGDGGVLLVADETITAQFDNLSVRRLF